MKKRFIGVEETEDAGTWTYLDRSAGEWFAWACGGCLIDSRNRPGSQHCNRCGEITETVETSGGLRLYRALRWMLQQIHFGHYRVEDMANEEVLSVLVGRSAAAEDAAPDEVIQETKKRFHSVNLAGLLAQARESGTPPKFFGLAERVRSTAGPGAFLNTEFHYAFELIGILKKIRERSFVLETPPILGAASSWAVSLLGEATRCYLFGFNRASVSLSRACMERSLRENLPRKEKGKRGLKRLVNASHRLGLLDGPHRDLANQVRRRGNRMLHRKPGEEPEKGSRSLDEDAWEVLFAARAVVSHLFQ